VWISPIDVVLIRIALVVRPDLALVSEARMHGQRPCLGSAGSRTKSSPRPRIGTPTARRLVRTLQGANAGSFTGTPRRSRSSSSRRHRWHTGSIYLPHERIRSRSAVSSVARRNLRASLGRIAVRPLGRHGPPPVNSLPIFPVAAAAPTRNKYRRAREGMQISVVLCSATPVSPPGRIRYRMARIEPGGCDEPHRPRPHAKRDGAPRRGRRGLDQASP
jgi:hypothetical protein